MSDFLHKIADADVGMNRQAVQVLRLLSKMVVPCCHGHGVQFQTWAWYNGRERGFVLMVWPSFLERKCLMVAVAECRNSDDIVVYDWTAEQSMDPPSGDLPEDAWKKVQRFKVRQFKQVAKAIQDMIVAHLAVDEVMRS